MFSIDVNEAQIWHGQWLRHRMKLIRWASVQPRICFDFSFNRRILYIFICMQLIAHRKGHAKLFNIKHYQHISKCKRQLKSPLSSFFSPLYTRKQLEKSKNIRVPCHPTSKVSSSFFLSLSPWFSIIYSVHSPKIIMFHTQPVYNVYNRISVDQVASSGWFTQYILIRF